MKECVVINQKEYDDLVKRKFTGKAMLQLQRGEHLDIHVGKGKNKHLIASTSNCKGFVILQKGMIHCEEGPAIEIKGISDRYFYLKNDCYINDKDSPSVKVFSKSGRLTEIRFFNEQAKLHNISGPALVWYYNDNKTIVEEFAVNGKGCSKESFLT